MFSIGSMVSGQCWCWPTVNQREGTVNQREAQIITEYLAVLEESSYTYKSDILTEKGLTP